MYSFEPIPEELTTDESHRVLGAQAQIWREYLPTPGHVQYMAFPRLIALAEVTWSPKERKDYQNFLGRLGVHEERLQLLHVNFRPTKKAESK